MQQNKLAPWRKALQPNSSVLCLGEGNFTGAAALCELRKDLGLNSDRFLAIDRNPIGSTQIRNRSLEIIESHAGSACISPMLDVTNWPSVWEDKWDVIIFNCPHTGENHREDPATSLQSNEDLLNAVFQLANGILNTDGHLIISLKGGQPYVNWNLLAKAESHDFIVTCRGNLDALKIYGYIHTTTTSNIKANVDNAEVFVFQRKLKFTPHEGTLSAERSCIAELHRLKGLGSFLLREREAMLLDVGTRTIIGKNPRKGVTRNQRMWKFVFEIELGAHVYDFQGRGKTKKKAKQIAAQNALRFVRKHLLVAGK
jgi:hypothetical protein